MKKLFILFMLFLSVAIVSCSKRDKMKENFKLYLDSMAKDPKSYEPVEFTITDTVTIGKIIKRHISNLNNSILTLDSCIKIDTKTIKDYNTFVYVDVTKEIKEAKSNIDDAKKIIKKCELTIDSLTKCKTYSSNEIFGYLVKHKFRLKNGFGGLDLDVKYLEYDKDFNLLYVHDIESYSEIDYKYFK